jgi:hypothetical protein
MRPVWSERTIATLVALAAGCAALPASDAGLEGRVTAALERGGLGVDALAIIDNVLRHGAPPPRLTPPVVREVLARPLDSADAAALFGRAVPKELLLGLEGRTALPFEDLLKTCLEELAQAQALLRTAVRPFDDAGLLRALAEGLPAAGDLLTLAERVDAPALERANLRFIAASARFAAAVRDSRLPEGKSFQTALGPVVIGTRGNDRHGPDAALIIDPGGDDTYERAPVRDGRVSVIVDLGGNDRYSGSDVALRGLSAIVDLAGDDVYAMDGPGLGAAIAGASLLVDLAGNDSYDATFFAQGAAAFGIGALIDHGGNDRYRVTAWGQGLGLAGGVGLLWERAGNDAYLAAGLPDAFNRGGGISGAQGAGYGLRGVIGGGIGILRDDGGDDRYEAQMFAQGMGYYYALGLLWDGAGADRYHAVRYAQGNGVHQALGVLRDEAGEDHYEVALGYGQGMGLDLAVGTLLDAGGDDAYRAGFGAQGAAIANGFGLLADSGGADRSDLGVDGRGRSHWQRGLPSVAILLQGSEQRAESVPAKPSAPLPCPAASPAPPQPQLPIVEALRRSAPGFYGEPFDAGAYAEVRRRLGTSVRATMAELPREAPDSVWAFGDALRCTLHDAPEASAAQMWREMEEFLAADPATPFAVDIALAQRARPAPAAQAARMASLLDRHPRCGVRALSVRTFPRREAMQTGLRASCWQLQAAARAELTRLGESLPPNASLPSFLRQPPAGYEAD